MEFNNFIAPKAEKSQGRTPERRTLTEFVHRGEIKTFEDFAEKRPMYWLPRKEDIVRLLEIARQVDALQVANGDKPAGKPLRFLDVGGANGFLGTLLIGEARRRGLPIEYVVADPDEVTVEKAKAAYAVDVPELIFHTKTAAQMSVDTHHDDPVISEFLEKKRLLVEDAQKKQLNREDIKKRPEFYSRTFDAKTKIKQLTKEFYEQADKVEQLTEEVESITATDPSMYDVVINSWMPPDIDFTPDIRALNGAAIVYMRSTEGSSGIQKLTPRTRVDEEKWSYRPGTQYEALMTWRGYHVGTAQNVVTGKEKSIWTDNSSIEPNNLFDIQVRKRYAGGMQDPKVMTELQNVPTTTPYAWEGTFSTALTEMCRKENKKTPDLSLERIDIEDEHWSSPYYVEEGEYKNYTEPIW